MPTVPTEVVVTTIDLRPGAIFHTRYEIISAIGRGGMGMVYKARDRSLDEVVAIKVLRPDFAQDPKMAERFKSEIRLARRIRHKNVCTIHDYGEDRGLLYISMELIDGVDLKQLLRERGPFPIDQAYDISIQVAEGLQAVHEAGIIHRDLKTPNIMRDGTGLARLMDFGIAKRHGGETMTATGHIVGTPEYMSPEQAQGHKVDYRSDIYAVGIVIWEIFTGHVPFRGETPISTILKHLNEPPPLEGPEASSLPAMLKPVLRKCLAKDPADRFSTAAEVAEALRNARSPSRRQQPVATDELEAPTLPEARLRPAFQRSSAAAQRSPGHTLHPPAPTLHSPATPRGGRAMQPWLLAVPVVVVGAAFVLWRAQHASGPETNPTAAGSPDERPPFARPVGPLSPAASPQIAAAAPSPAEDLGGANTLVPVPHTTPTAAAVRPSPHALALTPVARATLHATAPVPPPPVATAAPATPPPVSAPTVAEGPGMLQIAVKPWGEVTVDGKVLGQTPIDRVTLPAGTHTVRVRHPLYEIWERPVVIRAGQIEKVVVDFAASGTRKQ